MTLGIIDDIDALAAKYGDQSETYTEEEEQAIKDIFEMIDSDEEMQLFRKYAHKSFVIIGLRACGLDAKKAYKCLKKLLLHATKTYPDLFAQIDPLNLQTVIRQNVFQIVKRPVDEGPAIAVVRIKNWDPSVPNANVEQLALAGALHIYAVAKMSPEIQRQGIILISDISGFKLSHARQASIDLLFKAVKLYSTIPPLVKGVVAVRSLFLFEQSFNFFKWVLPEHIRKIIHITRDDMTAVKKLVPPEKLPKEFGGTIPDNEAYYEDLEQQILADKMIFHLIKQLQDEFCTVYGIDTPPLKRRKSKTFC